jgi:hypothetical protein
MDKYTLNVTYEGETLQEVQQKLLNDLYSLIWIKED